MYNKRSSKKRISLDNAQRSVLTIGSILTILLFIIHNNTINNMHQQRENNSTKTTWIERKRFTGIKDARESFRVSSLKGNKKAAIANNEYYDYSVSDESSVIRTILKRAVTNQETCNTDIETFNKVKEGPKSEELLLLPTFGIINAIKNTMSNHTSSTTSKSTPSSSYNDYPYQCKLPPKKSCNETGYSVVLMGYKNSKMEKLLKGIKLLQNRRPFVKEIILVWNSSPATLQMSTPVLLEWDKDPTNVVRIHYTFSNNLYNRWHPNIQPKSNALLYFDDDGPYYTSQTVKAGFELWKRNSHIPVSCFSRNYRFQYMQNPTYYSNVRMVKEMQLQIKNGIDEILHNKEHRHSSTSTSSEQQQFLSFCPSTKGDILDYNYNKIPQFGGHMFLPSGTFIHANFLCFLWHPVFKDIHEFVLNHPTHPDDVAVSAILSQVTGVNFKVYPRIVDEVKNENKQNNEFVPPSSSSSSGNSTTSSATNKIATQNNMVPGNLNQNRRRLLWKQTNWANMRTEAINSIIGYFGSMQPGTIGWCVGTKYFNPNNDSNSRNTNMKSKSVISTTLPLEQVCTKEKPTSNDIPWLNYGGLGFDQC